MNDDSTGPTHQDRTAVTVTVTVSLDEVAARSVDVTSGIREEDLRLLDAYNHELAIEASEDPRPNTAEEDEEDAELLRRAELTMSMTPEEVAIRRARRKTNQ
jgi:hypothetical protein